MIEQELFKTHFLGRDGFVWWVGQIVDARIWKTNQPGTRTDTTSDHKGFAERYRVRIMGYHTADNKALPDNDLPWATIMYPVTAGSGGATASESANLKQGTFVFGFFLDGEEGQVPVIMGQIGYNEYTAVMRNVPPVPFLPFDGYERLDRRAQYAIKNTPEAVAGVQVKPPGTTGGGSPEKIVTPGSPIPKAVTGGTPKDPQPKIINSNNNQNQALVTAQEPLMFRDGIILTDRMSPRGCGPNQMKGMQLNIKNAIHRIEIVMKEVEKFGTEQRERLTNFREKIQKIMDETNKYVSEKVKWVVKEIRKNTIERVNNKVKDTYYLFYPNQRPGVKKVQEKALNGISCLFDKVIKGLFGIVGKFLNDLVSKVVNTAICVIENFVGGLMSKLTGFISGILDNILGPLQAILGIGSLSIGLIGSIFDTVLNVLGFFNCESKPSCTGVDQNSPWDGIGDNGGKAVSLKKIFDQAKTIASQTTSTINQVASLPSTIQNALNGLSFNDLFNDTCGVGPLLCGPPTVTFSGGGGSGAAGNAIISATGDILGVDITSSGSGYTSAPTISFGDACGKGKGAVAKVIMTPGVNSSGSGGSTFTPVDGLIARLRNDTVLKASDGPVSGTTASGITIGGTGGVPITINGETVTYNGTPLLSGGTGGTPVYIGDVNGGFPLIVNGKPLTVGGTGGIPLDVGRSGLTVNGLSVTVGGSSGTTLTFGNSVITTTSFGPTTAGGDATGVTGVTGEVTGGTAGATGIGGVTEVTGGATGTGGVTGGTGGVTGGTGGVTGGTGGVTGGTAAATGTGTLSGNDGITGSPTDLSIISVGSAYFDSSNVATSGGSGTGLSVNIEVSEEFNGSVIDVSISDAGIDYKVGDVITILSGNGDASFRIDAVQGPSSNVSDFGTGGVLKVIMLDPGYGYLPAPNGDSGGEGRVWNTKDQTVVRRSTLDFDRPYNPGQTINLNPGDNVTLPIGSSETISDSDGNILETIPGGVPYVVSNVGTITAPSGSETDIPLSQFPSAANGQYPVVLELDEIYVKNSGFGYNPSDKIVMEPDNGAILQPVFDQNGSVDSIKILKGVEGFKEMPLIYIDSDTGYNAEIVPVFKINRVGDRLVDEPSLGQKVVSVIDCVGKF